MKRFIKLNSNNEIIAIRQGESLIEGEIESDVGEIGDIMQSDGSFLTPEPNPILQKPTLEERMEQLQQDNLILMDALAVTFEEVLNLKAQLGGTP